MTPPTVNSEIQEQFDVFLAAGKLVLIIDYATTPSHIDDAYARSPPRGTSRS